jgi:hypothetical protein
VAHGIISVLPIAVRKYTQYSEGYLDNFAVFQDVDVFIARFIAEPLLMFGGNAEFPELSFGNIGLFHGSPTRGPPGCSVLRTAALKNYTIR